MESVAWLVVVILGFIACFWFLIQQANAEERDAQAMRWAVEQAEQQRNATYTSYQQSLAALKADPTNAHKKQYALDYGRSYSNLTRDKRGVTLYNEMALMNDINAATAGASSVAPASASLESRLQRLTDLRGQGIITDQEWADRRREILAEI